VEYQGSVMCFIFRTGIVTCVTIVLYFIIISLLEKFLACFGSEVEGAYKQEKLCLRQGNPKSNFASSDKNFDYVAMI
jgi:hypothetical protein